MDVTTITKKKEVVDEVADVVADEVVTIPHKPHENANPRKDKSMIKCYSCRKYGHYAAQCRNKERDEEANLMFSKDEEPTLMLAEKMPNLLILKEEKVIANPFIDIEDQVETNMWYLDNGVSNHMTGDQAKFKELDEKFIGNVKLCDGSIVPIQGKESILFQCKNGDKHLLTSVYYIPSLKSNIISLGQMIEEGSKVEIVDPFLKVYD